MRCKIYNQVGATHCCQKQQPEENEGGFCLKITCDTVFGTSEHYTNKFGQKKIEFFFFFNFISSPRPYVVFSALFGMFGTSTSFCLELPSLPQGFLLSLIYGKAVPEARICGKRRYTENFDFEVTWEGHFYYIRVHFFSKTNILLPL